MPSLLVEMTSHFLKVYLLTETHEFNSCHSLCQTFLQSNDSSILMPDFCNHYWIKNVIDIKRDIILIPNCLYNIVIVEMYS